MLPKFTKLFNSKSKSADNDNFLVASINPEHICLGFFVAEGNSTTLEGSTLEPRSSDLFAVLSKCLASLTKENQNLPTRLIIGYSDPSVESMTTVARLKMDQKSSEITTKDIEKILIQVGEDFDSGGKKLFFSSITSAVLDGVRVGNPIGARGEHLELGCFNAYLDKENLDFFDKLANEHDLFLEKIIPTEYSVVRSFLDSGTKEGILLQVLDNHTSLSFVEDSNIVGVKMYSLGTLNPDLWVNGLKIALDEFKDHPDWPNLVSFYDTPDFQELAKSIEKELPEKYPALKDIKSENFNERAELGDDRLSLVSLSVEGMSL